MMARYYTRDHLGSIRELVNSSGTLLTRYSYDPYGRGTSTYLSGSTDATFQYTGDYYHAASGLNLTKFRAYDPNTARWLSRDPKEENEELNLYEYVKNMPVDAIDPLGLSLKWYEAGTPKESHGWAEHTNWLTFTMTCQAGTHVDRVKLVYDSWEGGWGTALNVGKNAGQGFASSVRNVNCNGQASEVDAWENTRFAAPYALSIYSNRANYVNGTRVFYTCKCCNGLLAQ